MCEKNMKRRNERRNKKFNDSIKFIKDFDIFIKQCYRIVSSVEKIFNKKHDII